MNKIIIKCKNPFVTKLELVKALAKALNYNNPNLVLAKELIDKNMTMHNMLELSVQTTEFMVSNKVESFEFRLLPTEEQELTESEKKMTETSRQKSTNEYQNFVVKGVKLIKIEGKNKELNLCELLKDCIGMKFYTPHFGDLFLSKIDIANHAIILTDYIIKVPIHESGVSQTGMNASEICVFPSKEQRDWSLFQPPWIPQKGERVWAGGEKGMIWNAGYFVEMEDGYYKIEQSGSTWTRPKCVPFDQIPW